MPMDEIFCLSLAVSLTGPTKNQYTKLELGQMVYNVQFTDNKCSSNAGTSGSYRK